MPTRIVATLSVLSVPWWGAACLTFHPTTVGQKTSLERQLMGKFEPLTEEELLAASVRAPGVLGKVDSQALRARRRQLFNRDDVDELKAQGCLGEALDAKLVARACAREADPQAAAVRDRVVEQETQDRAAIVEWVIQGDPQLTPKDKPNVLNLYRQLILGRARPGDWVQGDDGTWAQH